MMALAGIAAGAAWSCGEPQKPAPAPARAPVAPAAPAADPPPPAAPPPTAAPSPAGPKDLASATRENPLRPEPLTGDAVRDDIGKPTGGPPKLDALKLPPGFAIEVYASDVPNARSLALGAPGIVYVSTRRDKRVYAVVDRNRDHKPEKTYTIASGLDTPNGLAYRNGSLYIGQIPRVLRLDGIDTRLANPPRPVVVTDKLPTHEHHGWRYMRFGPDGWLYIAIGAPCNLCKREDPIFATIARMKPEGGPLEIFASGVRNSVGFDWHPETHELWFTENGRDELGNDIPPDELDRAPRAGMHFGFPYCHDGVIRDPEFNDRSCTEFEPPVQALGPHVAALGMRFYTGNMFPPSYKNAIIIAEHGSWNRERKLGFRVMVVRLDGNKAVSYEPLVTGWLDEQTDQAWGRPVDVEVLDDGSLLISDDWKGVLYRVTYKK
ncbi:MAG TPA: sorbosone dehydrogenase family protein [Kofleriaceae bacterium]|nr:sorbosone dehydrogenase family protein [Kofleriaceae bacterium]